MEKYEYQAEIRRLKDEKVILKDMLDYWKSEAEKANRKLNEIDSLIREYQSGN